MGTKALAKCSPHVCCTHRYYALQVCSIDEYKASTKDQSDKNQNLKVLKVLGKNSAKGPQIPTCSGPHGLLEAKMTLQNMQKSKIPPQGLEPWYPA